MSDAENHAHQRDLRSIEELISTWFWAAGPLTAALGMLGVRLLSNLISDWKIFKDILIWLYEVVPADDVETKSNIVLLMMSSVLLLVSLLIAREIVGAIISQRMLTRINRTPFPMTTVKDLSGFIANHSKESMRERFFFVARGEPTARADSSNAGHRGSLGAAFGFSLLGLFLLGAVNPSS